MLRLHFKRPHLPLKLKKFIGQQCVQRLQLHKDRVEREAKESGEKWLRQDMHHFPVLFIQFNFRIDLILFFIYCSTGILRHLTVVRTSSLFGHVTKPAPAPVNIEKLQEEAQKVLGKGVVIFTFFNC